MNRTHRHTLRRRTAAGLLALTMALLSPGSVMARTTQEVEAEQAQLEQEHQELQAKLESLREDENQKQEYQETLQKQIDVLVNQINTARSDIEALNASIQELDMKLNASAEEASETIEKFKERVEAIYRAGSVSTLEILFQSDSFSDFSLRTEMLGNMSRRDKELLDKIQAYIDDTKEEREEREKQKAMVAELKKGLETKQKEVDALYAENAQAIAELQEAQGATQGAIAENESRAEDLTAELQARNEEYGGDRGHRGMDIAGPAMTEIVAAESGTVIRAWTQDSWGMGWGYHVYIYHNSTYSTLYAHMNQLAVSTGEYVTQGQVIGYEGSTGDSTGPHLHFEVWENGDRVNPRNYL